MKKFEVGKQYWHNFICSHDTVVFYYVVRRTAKSIWIDKDPNGKGERKLIKEWSDCEHVSLGNYSMAPSLYARNEVSEAAQEEPILKPAYNVEITFSEFVGLSSNLLFRTADQIEEVNVMLAELNDMVILLGRTGYYKTYVTIQEATNGVDFEEIYKVRYDIGSYQQYTTLRNHIEYNIDLTDAAVETLNNLFGPNKEVI